MKTVVIGIDIGGTNTVFGIVTRSGNVLVEGKIPTKGYTDVSEYIAKLSGKIKERLNAFENDVDLIGIGVGAPNGNIHTGNIEFAPNLDWKGVVPLSELLNSHFDVPVKITNDANAAALGEMKYGGAQKMNDFIFITLGTGLGSGIVSNGNIVYGHAGFAGEIGHTIAVRNGRLCGCGRRGCLETYASASGIVKTAREYLENDACQSSLRKYNSKELTSKQIYDEAKLGDPTALKIFDYTARILGQSLADSVAYTGPEAIFLFGGLAKAEDLLLVPTKQYMEQNLLSIYKNKVKILPSELKDGQAAVIGAAALIWSN